MVFLAKSTTSPAPWLHRIRLRGSLPDVCPAAMRIRGKGQGHQTGVHSSFARPWKGFLIRVHGDIYGYYVVTISDYYMVDDG